LIVIFLAVRIWPCIRQMCVMGSESNGQTGWPHSGQVFVAGLPQMWQAPMRVIE